MCEMSVRSMLSKQKVASVSSVLSHKSVLNLNISNKNRNAGYYWTTQLSVSSQQRGAGC